MKRGSTDDDGRGNTWRPVAGNERNAARTISTLARRAKANRRRSNSKAEIGVSPADDSV